RWRASRRPRVRKASWSAAVRRRFRTYHALPNKPNATLGAPAQKRQRTGALQDADAHHGDPACAKRLGVRRSAAAFARTTRFRTYETPPSARRPKSARGLAHSKTLTRITATP